MGRKNKKFNIAFQKVSRSISKQPQFKIGHERGSSNNPLEGSRFRWLNESLYTEDSGKSFDLFQNDPSLFQAYHTGFRSQASAWPITPVDECCGFILKKLKSGSTIGDFGCGDAKIAQQMKDKMKVHSFDLVSLNPLVTACNISDVPLADKMLDLAVFSLSLMGTDWPKFVAEAQRCLKTGGVLYIAEVQSRIPEFQKFMDGFNKAFQVLEAENVKGKYFVRVILKKQNDCNMQLDHALLKPCLYKRR